MSGKVGRASVVPLRQTTQYNCLAASMTACLRANGVLPNECSIDEVNKVLGALPLQGAAWEQALATAQYYGCRATLVVPSTVRQLKEWTDQGIPVMISWNPEGRDWSHASVVFDVDSDLNVYVADPNIPDPDETVRVVSKADFYAKWYEKWPKYLVRRPAMAIAREVTSDGRQVMASRYKISEAGAMGKKIMGKNEREGTPGGRQARMASDSSVFLAKTPASSWEVFAISPGRYYAVKNKGRRDEWRSEEADHSEVLEAVSDFISSNEDMGIKVQVIKDRIRVASEVEEAKLKTDGRKRKVLDDLSRIRGVERREFFENGGTPTGWMGGASSVEKNKSKYERREKHPRNPRDMVSRLVGRYLEAALDDPFEEALRLSENVLYQWAEANGDPSSRITETLEEADSAGDLTEVSDLMSRVWLELDPSERRRLKRGFDRYWAAVSRVGESF